MNKLLLVLFLFINFNLSGQSDNEPLSIFEKHHELKLGVIKILVGPIIEGTYEYVKDRNMGYGASLLINLNIENDYFEDFSIAPFFRMYFDNDEQYGAKGFFVETFLSFYSGKNFSESSDYNQFNNKDDKFFETALGFSVGKKWINHGGFVLETRFGIGRNLLGNSNFEAVYKGDVSIGYRF